MMGFLRKQGFWLVLVALVVGQASAAYKRHAMGRSRRQSDHWWRAHQSVSGMGSFRRGWGTADAEFGLDTPRRYPGADHNAAYDWGSPRMYIGGAGQPRQQVTPNPVSVACNEDKMVVTVQRDLYGNGKLVKTSDLSLGPQQCKPDSSSTDTTVVFSVGLQECGNIPQMNADLLMYSSYVTYNPSAASDLPITRTNSAVIQIQCYYPRHDNVSSEAIHPTWIPFSSTLSYEEKLNFTLRLMNGDWSGPSLSTIFNLGDTLNIEAAVGTENHVPMSILVDRCVASLNLDASQGPSYEIISFNGCLVDGKQEDSSSAFRPQRPQPNEIQFTVDAFKFTDVDSPVIFITCWLRAIPVATPPDAMNKACSYSKTSNSWYALDGPSSICSCCDLGRCDSTTSGSRGFRLSGGSRHPWKRDLVSDNGPKDEEWLVTLGPLYIVGADANKAFKTESSLAMEIWMVTGVGSLWLVVLLACILVWKIKPKNPGVSK